MSVSDSTPATAATPEALIESLRLDAQSEYGQGWNKGMADAVAMLRADGWLRATAVPFALEMDDYEAANLLHALVTHPCLNSGDWYLQLRHKLDRWTLTTGPNPLYCQRNGGHLW